MVCSRKNEKGRRRETIFYLKHATENLDFILEIASRSITLKKIINKNTNYFM
jgi:hypothetical protein